MLRNLITDVAGVRVGHATDLDLASGVTAVLFDRPASVSVAVLGGAPGGRDTDMLSPCATMPTIDGVVLSGGSVFGLDAPGGAQAALREAGRGFTLGGTPVPLVSGAILFDLLNGGNKGWGRHAPYRDLGYAAARVALAADGAGDFALGTVGAGTGATTATVKGGLGSASAVSRSGAMVGALVAVNAMGSPLVGNGPWFWAAPFERGDEFGGRGWPAPMPEDALALRLKGGTGTATTIALVATDATLSKAQAHRLALMAHDGLARALLPAHAPMDGDTVFGAATGVRPGEVDALELTELGWLAAMTLARAIARGVHAATPLPQPGAQASWRQRFG